jgi:hypothetical protein
MKKSSAYITTFTKMDQNVCSGTKKDRHLKKKSLMLVLAGRLGMM